MLKAYKYRIYPTEEQKIQLAKTFGCVRFVYNYYLEKKIELYETEKRSWHGANFAGKLDYKAKWYGRTYHKIDRQFASGQTCSECGSKNKEVKLLSIREWVCKNCDTAHQRDENAAKNIAAKGIMELGIVV